jgi:hypothetical protein
MRARKLRLKCVVPVIGLALGSGCGAGDFDAQDDFEDELELASSEQALSSCGGDDSDSIAAALGVAVANELHRWDALSDFEVVNGQLVLSPSGEINCEGWRNEDPGGCENIRALLALQSDASAVISNHIPSTLRSKLTTWYGRQKSFLSNLVASKSKLDKGIYRIRSASTSRYLTVDAFDVVQQATSTTATTSQQWAISSDGTTHRLKNVASGKCLALESDGSGLVRLVQRICSTSTTQNFAFGDTGSGHAIFTKYGKALRANTPASVSVAAGVTQDTFVTGQANERWTLELYGTASHVPINEVPEGVYSMAVRHSGQYLAVDGGMTEDYAVMEQRTFESWDDRYYWYFSHSGSAYEVINRRSGKCMDLEVPSSSTSGLWQRVCNGSASQRFTFRPTGDGHMMMFTMYDRAVEIPNSSLTSDARFYQGATAWAPNRQFKLTAIAAGEPHVLTYNKKTADGPCGDYYWYNITRPNGQALKAPAESFMQLLFAGGKESLTAADTNPYIAQQVSGNLVAIDPTYGLNEQASTSTGACTAACTRITDNNLIGQCCSCNAVTKAYKRSAWSLNTYLCQ